MDKAYPYKKILSVVIGATIIFGSLLLVKSFVYSYTSSKTVAIELGSVLSLVAGLVILSHTWWKKIGKTPLFIGMSVFVFALIETSFFSHDALISWFGAIDRQTSIMLILLLSLFASVIGIAFSEKSARNVVLKPIALSAVVIVLSVWLEKMGWGFLGNAADGGVLGNTSITGTCLLVGVFVSAYLLSTTKKQHRWYYILILVFILLNPIFVNFNWFATGGSLFGIVGAARGATLSIGFGLLLAFVVWLIVHQKKVYARTGKIILGVIVVLVIGSVCTLSIRNNRLHDWFVSQASDTRFIYWDIALKGFYVHPIVGTGFETYGYTYQTYYNPEMQLVKNMKEIWSNKPHNAYLEFLSTTGIVGTLGYILLMTGFIWSLIRGYRTTGNKKLLIFFSGFFGAYLLNNLIFFDTPTSYLLVYALFGYVLSVQPVSGYAKDTTIAKTIRYSAAGVILVVSLIIFIPQITKLVRAETDFHLTLNHKAAWYAKSNRVSSFGSGFELAERADYTYQHVYTQHLAELQAGTPEQKKIATEAIDALVTELEYNREKFPPNEQELLSIAHFESIKMAIVNAVDMDSLHIMKDASQAAISIAPTNPQGYWALGQAYIYEADYKSAMQIFQQALVIDPHVVESHLAIINLATLENNKALVASATKEMYATVAPEDIAAAQLSSLQ